jgi:predicted aspartyl protease
MKQAALRTSRSSTTAWAATILTVVAASPGAAFNLQAPSAGPGAPAVIDDLQEITVTGRGPRYVAPTLRDQIGRIWAPVLINGRGPFRLVLDTGASHSGVTAPVADLLGIPVDASSPVVLHGVTGSGTVPTIRVDSLSVGDLDVDSQILPILADAFGGAQGVLGGQGLADKRIFIDFKHDQIMITYSHGERAAHGFVAVPFHSVRGALILINAQVGGVAAKAIIDTGAQVTIANRALRTALLRSEGNPGGARDRIQGVTLEVEDGMQAPTPTITVGGIAIRNATVTYADAPIFEQWRLHDEPTIIIGMDVLGLFDTLVIDYRRHELQIRMAAI